MSARVCLCICVFACMPVCVCPCVHVFVCVCVLFSTGFCTLFLSLWSLLFCENLFWCTVNAERGTRTQATLDDQEDLTQLMERFANEPIWIGLYVQWQWTIPVQGHNNVEEDLTWHSNQQNHVCRKGNRSNKENDFKIWPIPIPYASCAMVRRPGWSLLISLHT